MEWKCKGQGARRHRPKRVGTAPNQSNQDEDGRHFYDVAQTRSSKLPAPEVTRFGRQTNPTIDQRSIEICCDVKIILNIYRF